MQHLVREHADELQAWVARGAAIYVCGSMQGMAGGVHDALLEVLGQGVVETFTLDGRYRRDVY